MQIQKNGPGLAVLGAILFLACIIATILVGSSIPAPVSINSSSAVRVASIDDSDVVQAQQIYSLQCASCHGAQGEGMLLIHPALNTIRVREELSAEDVRKAIADGAGIANIMPPYSSVLSMSDIDLLVRWLQAGM